MKRLWCEVGQRDSHGKFEETVPVDDGWLSLKTDGCKCCPSLVGSKCESWSLKSRGILLMNTHLPRLHLEPCLIHLLQEPLAPTDLRHNSPSLHEAFTSISIVFILSSLILSASLVLATPLTRTSVLPVGLLGFFSLSKFHCLNLGFRISCGNSHILLVARHLHLRSRGLLCKIENSLPKSPTLQSLPAFRNSSSQPSWTTSTVDYKCTSRGRSRS